jgi:iron complex transport system substrate-binding protein
MRLWSLIVGTVALFVVGCQKPVMHSKIVYRSYLYRAAVSLSPSTTELIAVKIMAIKLLGRTSSCNYPATVSPIPVVMNGVKPNFEKIISLKPDVIVYDPALFSDSDLAKFKEAKIPTYAVGENSVKDFIRRLYEFGAEFSTETALMVYIGDIDRAAAAAAANAPKERPTVAILIPDERGGHMISGTKSFVADVARISGAEVVGPDSTRFEKASIESLLSWNPATIICSPKYEWVVNDARLQSLSAVQGFKQGKSTIAQINGDLLMRQGGRVDLLIKNVSNFVSGSVKSK